MIVTSIEYDYRDSTVVFDIVFINIFNLHTVQTIFMPYSIDISFSSVLALETTAGIETAPGSADEDIDENCPFNISASRTLSLFSTASLLLAMDLAYMKNNSKFFANLLQNFIKTSLLAKLPDQC